MPLAVLLSARWGVEGVWYAIAGTTVIKALVKQLAFRWSNLPACAPADPNEDDGGESDGCVAAY